MIKLRARICQIYWAHFFLIEANMVENKDIERNILEINSLIVKINSLLNERENICLEVISDTILNFILLNKEHNFNKICFSELCKVNHDNHSLEGLTLYEKNLITEKNKYDKYIKLVIFEPEKHVPALFSASVSIANIEEHEGGDLISGLKSNYLNKQTKNNLKKIMRIMEHTPSATRQNSDYLSLLKDEDILCDYFDHNNHKVLSNKKVGLKIINRIAYDLFRLCEIALHKDDGAMITLEFHSNIIIYFNKKEDFERVCGEFIGTIDLDDFILNQKNKQTQLEETLSSMSEFNDFFIFGA